MNDKTYQKVWQYIKVMRYFTIMEIKILLSLDENNKIDFNYIDIYFKYLKDFGIIKKVEENNFVLNKNLGDLAPKIFDYQIMYDPNTDKIISINNTEEESFTNKNIDLYNGGKNDKIVH